MVELKPEAPEVVGPDGPITPLLEEFGTPLSDGSPNQVCTLLQSLIFSLSSHSWAFHMWRYLC